MIKIESPGRNAFDAERHALVPRLPSQVPDTTVVLPKDANLHDISQAYVDAYCKFTGARAPRLDIDFWDKGLTKTGKQHLLQSVCSEELNNLGPLLQQSARALLQEWHGALHDKLRALKKTDGCSGCFGRHANSMAIESHLRATVEDMRISKVESFLHAAESADPDALKKAIAGGVDVNTQDDCGRTALMLLLRNASQQDETRKRVDACATYLLSLPGIDVGRTASFDDGKYVANALGLAIRHGHESVARHLMADHPGVAFRGDDGATRTSCAGRHCPGLAKDVGMRLATDGKALAALYKEEMQVVGPQHKQDSHAFFCKVLSEICSRNVTEARMAMNSLVVAATELGDREMISAAIREWHSQVHVLTGNIVSESDSRPTA